MFKITNTSNAPEAIGPYSQAISCNGFLFSSGQIPLIPGTGAVAGDTIETQAEQVMKNISAVLNANKINFNNVVKTTCFLASMEDFTAFNQIYAQYFTSKPARSCVAAKELPKNVLCEVEFIAVL